MEILKIEWWVKWVQAIVHNGSIKLELDGKAHCTNSLKKPHVYDN
jgi:hypothetical protein